MLVVGAGSLCTADVGRGRGPAGVAHFAGGNARSTATELVSSDDGDAHTSLAALTNFEG